MRISLMRHGKPDVPAISWLRAGEMEQWIASYNQAGLCANQVPSEAALDIASQAGLIVSSDLPRSMGSARLLGSNRQYVSDSLFREAGLPYSSIPLFRLPPQLWAICFRISWLGGHSRHCESLGDFHDRVIRATSRLIELAGLHESVLLVGHGIINRFLAKELLAAGWSSSGGRADRYWEFVEFSNNERKE